MLIVIIIFGTAPAGGKQQKQQKINFHESMIDRLMPPPGVIPYRQALLFRPLGFHLRTLAVILIKHDLPEAHRFGSDLNILISSNILHCLLQ